MSPPAEPLVRAQFCQEWLARIENEDEPWRSRFGARLPAAIRDSIASASRVGWVPMKIYVTLADVLHETFGPLRAHDYYRRAFAASLRGPLFGPLVKTGVRLLGVSPATLVRLAPRGYEASFKDAGRMVGEVTGETQARLDYSGLPAVCTASDAWLISAQGSAYGALDFLGVRGVVRLDVSRRTEGGMSLTIEWTTAR